MDTSSEHIGVDEAGRGCLAGPVCAAAVLWDPMVLPLEVREERVLFLDPATGKKVAVADSKKLSPKQREASRAFIERHAAAFAVEMVDAAAVDADGIVPCTMRAMRLAALRAAAGRPVRGLRVDGTQFVALEGLPHECIVGGDAKVLAIAAASILAKTHRDACICASPFASTYGWGKNKGYGTAAHMLAIQAHGLCPEHRRTFCGGAKGKGRLPKECLLLTEDEQQPEKNDLNS